MDAVFLKLLNMSITASWLILAVIAARFALKKAPKWMNCALWGLVGLRLLFPFSIESVLSLIPSAETVSPDILYSQTPEITSGIPAINGAINPVISGSLAPEVGASVNPIQILTAVSSVIWLVGVAAMLLYAAVSYLWMRRKVRASIHVREAVWICDDIKTPFILGIFKPRIYLPSGMDEGTEAHVIAHENAHLKRRDHWWKPLGFLLLAVYWFNPVVWLAYILLCRDIELACDEKVIRGMEKGDMLAYSEALYSCSVPRKMVMVCPLAFGEVGVKERIKTVLNYKKPAFWIIAGAVIACVVVAVCFLTSPKVELDSYLLFDSQASTGDTVAHYSASFGDEIKRATIYIEEWQNGVCIDDKAAIYAAPFDSLSITQNIPRDNDVWTGLDVGVYVDGNGGAPLLASFHFPDGTHYFGESWCEYGMDSESEKLEITAGTEYILAAMVFDDGSGIRVFNCETLMAEPERLASYQYAVVVRVVFRSEKSVILGEIDLHAAALSLNDVIILSQKGEELTWADFNGYSYIETGSGLYIRVYEIDEMFSLWIGGGSTNVTPMYIRLVSEANRDDYIDIRTEDVTDFISAHRFDVLPVTFGSADLDRDGKAESFEVSETDPVGIYTLDVLKDDGSALWSEDAGTAHVGWNGLYLYQGEDGFYILRYNPTMYQGEADYHYELFTLEGGEVHTAASRSVKFSVNPNSLPTEEKLAEMNSFASEVNALLKNSIVLLSTAKEGELFLGGVSAEPFMEDYSILDDAADPLDAAVSAAIMDHNKNGYHAGDFACESHVILASAGGGPASSGKIETVSVYAMVLYQEYGFSGATFHEVSGSHIPTVLTFDIGEDGTYTLTEYWIPRDGSYYAPDIREKFPAGSVEDALDTQKYILAQKQNCYAQAVEYGKVDTDAVIGQLLDVITSSPASSSNPGDYIDAHLIEYRELTYYGDYTLKYVFSEFLKGGQTDLRGHIMRSIMDDLIGGEALGLEADTGQEYFDAWRAHVEGVYAQNDATYMQEKCPKGWLLLQMIG